MPNLDEQPIAFVEAVIRQDGQLQIRHSTNLPLVVYILEQTKLQLLQNATKGDEPPRIKIPNFLPKDLG